MSIIKRFASISILFFVALPVSAISPIDSYYQNQWYLENIHAPEAWDITTGSSNVVVAVLDTGLDLDHPDIKQNIWINSDEISGDGVDNDHNGYIDDIYGWDFVEDDNTPYPTEGLEALPEAVTHGTAIAGIIGAVGNNNQGIAGINWSVKIMPVRILDNMGIGETQSAKNAIMYAIENGADVINLSFTGFEFDPAFEEVVQMAYTRGVVFVAAVGNEPGGGVNMDKSPIYPACFGIDKPGDLVIGVAATTK
ncbi:MAG: S8 family serine peptidase, partial [Patescibacteria group bacterium]